jgi:hypothetical protein
MSNIHAWTSKNNRRQEKTEMPIIIEVHATGVDSYERLRGPLKAETGVRFPLGAPAISIACLTEADALHLRVSTG